MLRSFSVNGVAVTVDGEIGIEEMTAVVTEECEVMKRERNQEVASVHISVLGDDELEIITRPKSPIRRVRRITGYLSEIENFNSAKRAETDDRVVHVV
ncbi:MAG: hypothetical protein N3A57_01150 [Negativicutes bacterium]|nr:hypothetical protein [Negativicutes bacterium]